MCLRGFLISPPAYIFAWAGLAYYRFTFKNNLSCRSKSHEALQEAIFKPTRIADKDRVIFPALARLVWRREQRLRHCYTENRKYAALLVS